jgi:2-polyprenyl-6-methoxyphenol hydroxylase-like FAD-dependent oxidoreductase
MRPRIVPHNRPPQVRTYGNERSEMRMSEHAVVIAGGGPAGMMLAAELALAKVDVAIVERRPDHVLVGSRAGGFNSRTVEVLDQRGVADRFLAEGQVHEAMPFGTIMLDTSDFPTRHPYFVGIFQNEIERIMAAWIAELRVPILYAREVTGFAQDDAGVDVELSDGQRLRAQYLVGCDGGRSVIRKAAAIEFPGWDPTRSNLIAEVQLTEQPPSGARHDATGIHGLHRTHDGKTFRAPLRPRRDVPANRGLTYGHRQLPRTRPPVVGEQADVVFAVGIGRRQRAGNTSFDRKLTARVSLL